MSFKYPVQLGKPAFCMTNTYQACGKNGDKVRIVTYIDGPFFANTEAGLNKKEQQKDLRNRVYECMVERSKLSNVQVVRYIRN